MATLQKTADQKTIRDNVNDLASNIFSKLPSFGNSAAPVRGAPRAQGSPPSGFGSLLQEARAEETKLNKDNKKDNKKDSNAAAAAASDERKNSGTSIGAKVASFLGGFIIQAITVMVFFLVGASFLYWAQVTKTGLGVGLGGTRLELPPYCLGGGQVGGGLKPSPDRKLDGVFGLARCGWPYTSSFMTKPYADLSQFEVFQRYIVFIIANTFAGSRSILQSVLALFGDFLPGTTKKTGLWAQVIEPLYIFIIGPVLVPIGGALAPAFGFFGTWWHMFTEWEKLSVFGLMLSVLLCLLFIPTIFGVSLATAATMSAAFTAMFSIIPLLYTASRASIKESLLNSRYILAGIAFVLFVSNALTAFL